MTIATTTSVVTYQGNGATTNFTFSFVGDNSNYIEVYLTNKSGIVSLLPDSQYTLILNSAPVGGLWGIGGSITYPISGTPLTVGNYLTIVRAVPYTQSISISNQGAFYPQAVEQALDVLELQIQQINTDLAYTLHVPLEDIVPPNELPSAKARANGYLAFDANGQPIIVGAPSVTPTPGSYATPRRISTTGTATINIVASDSFGGVSIYQSGTPNTTLQLPDGYGPFPIFDASLNAGTYAITILPPPGKTILGQSAFYMSFNGQSITAYDDGQQILIG